MDPVQELPVEVMEEIFGFLSKEDLLKATLVSSKWNEMIGRSLKCMEPLKLGLHGGSYPFKPEHEEFMVNGRNFSNVVISEATAFLPLIYDVFSVKAHWKIVHIFCTSFETVSDFEKLLKTFEQTVEHLMLIEVTIQEENVEIIDLKLKKLKTLSIACTDDRITHSVLSNCQELESLKLGYVEVTEELEKVPKKIEKLKNLKELLLTPTWFEVMFSETLKAVKFHLKSLSVTNLQLDNDESVQHNFIHFLDTQTSTLEKLNLGGIFNVEVVKKALEMKILEDLSIAHLPRYQDPNDEFPSSSTIRVLDIPTLGLTNGNLLKQILGSVPKLKKLRMRSIVGDMAEFIVANLTGLRLISTIHNVDSESTEMFHRN